MSSHASARDLRRARVDGRYLPEARAALLLDANPLAGLSLLLLLAVVAAGGYWADRAVLDVVTRGQGEVISSSREQVIQSLDGGILAELLVREGDVVDKGQILLRIDDTRFAAALREGQTRAVALRAAIARLRAEATGGEPEFPTDLPADVVSREKALFESRLHALEQGIAGVRRSLALAQRELTLTEPLVKEGVVSEVEVLRLRRDVNELTATMADRLASFRATARSDLADKETELAGIKEVLASRSDQLQRTVVRSPMRGTVKKIFLTTVGGVIRPGGEIMQIVPLEDQLLVEARIRPSDVAFLRPGLPATVKITAYDFSIYGGLKGTLESISPDTIADERNRGESFYRIRVRTETNYLYGRGQQLPIIPGMTATVEILTGHKTVLEYLLKPVLKTQQNALRER